MGNEKVLGKAVVKDSTFYQSKYEYYRKLNNYVMIAICLSEVGYLFSDMYLLGGVVFKTLVPRTIIMLPLVIFLMISKTNKNYKVMTTLTFVLSHLVMWCTIWSCTFLPDLAFASDGFIIIDASFIAIGIASPYKRSIVANAFLFVDILIANTFLHYPDLVMMFLLGVPLFLGISAFSWAIENSYTTQYIFRKKLEENAFRDQLTGVFNRNIMSRLTRKDLSFGSFYTGGLSIIIMDIDFFKKVNDTYGHDSGDVVLKSVSATVESKLNQSDYMIRWGGEEFLILIQGGKEYARQKAEEIRVAVENSDNGICPVTISLGVSTYAGGDYNKSVQKADKALYQAKETGRNKVVVSE